MRILIAEDDAVSRRVLQHALERWGHEIVTTNHGRDAWEILEQQNPPRLAILDWMMPVMDGIQLCRRIRETPRIESMYIILLTAKGQKEDIIEGLHAGADDYVQKPFDRQELHARVHVGERVLTLQDRLSVRISENARLEMLNQAARALAHHVRNALTPLLGMAELSKTDISDEGKQLCEMVIIQGQRIAAIIDALIEMADSGEIPLASYAHSEERTMLDMEARIRDFLEERINRTKKES